MEVRTVVYFDCGHTALLGEGGHLVASAELPPRLPFANIEQYIALEHRGKINIKAFPVHLCTICTISQEEALRGVILATLREEGLPEPTPEKLTQLIAEAKRAQSLYDKTLAEHKKSLH